MPDRECDHGGILAEYGLLIVLIAVVVIAAVVLIGPKVSEYFNTAGGGL